MGARAIVVHRWTSVAVAAAMIPVALAGDDGRGMVWPDSMPQEITEEIEREAGRKPPPVVEERPSLRVLPAVDESESRPSSPPKPGERPSYLKVVK